MKKPTAVSLRKDLQRIARNCREQIAVVEWWNRNRADAEPMDCEPERVILRMAIEAMKKFDPPGLKEFTAACKPLWDYARKLSNA